jgi:hypothetical protein
MPGRCHAFAEPFLGRPQGQFFAHESLSEARDCAAPVVICPCRWEEGKDTASRQKKGKIKPVSRDLFLCFFGTISGSLFRDGSVNTSNYLEEVPLPPIDRPAACGMPPRLTER